jgi:predicted esterase
MWARAVFILLAWLLLLAGTSPLGAADWESQLDELLKMPAGAERDARVAEVAGVLPGWREASVYLKSLAFPEVETGEFALDQALCLDGVERPWLLYVPSSYDPEYSWPLYVKLHGGVSTPNLPDDPIAEEQDSPYIDFAEQFGYLMLFPYGQADATWWDEVGMANIANQVRLVKQRYNIDDDRVYMGGFSDGSSASFLHAMVAPTDYAAFVALNGHLGVGSLDGDLPTYASNLANTPVYATTTFDDELYPSRRMRPAIEMALAAGGNLFYSELPGHHDFDFADMELPRIADFLWRHPRDPFPHHIVWEAAEPEFGRCRWFSIDRVALGDAADWYTDYNATLVDEMIAIGFMPDDSFEGPGVKVGSVVDGYAADSLGLREGDVIVRAGDKDIADIEDVGEFKTGLHRGDPLTMVVERDGQEVMLAGQMPPPESYFVFKREKPSAKAIVDFAANHIDIQGSRLGAFSIYVHPGMFRLDEEVVITVNGDEVYRQLAEPDLAFMLQNYLDNRDRQTLYVAKISIEL